MTLQKRRRLSKAFVPLPGGGAAVYTSSGLTSMLRLEVSIWILPARPRTQFPASTTFCSGNTMANQGRWPWPDPAGMGAVKMGNPQTWNRYAYVGNMPLIATDPLGLLSHWSDVAGTGRWGFLDGLRDPGGALFAAITQAWAMFNSPSFSGQMQYFGSIKQNWNWVPDGIVTSQIDDFVTLDGQDSGIMGVSHSDIQPGYWQFLNPGYTILVGAPANGSTPQQQKTAPEATRKQPAEEVEAAWPTTRVLSSG